MEQRIGPYLVLRQLGAGPRGVVHEAVDEALGRRVAVKVLAPGAEADAHLRRRFAREAGALAALRSRHLVRVHGHGEDDEQLWVASRLMTGGDLGRLLRIEGPLRAPQALALVGEVAAGLADAHEAGVAHRNITPANVFVDRRDGRVVARLGDFDLAPAQEADLGQWVTDDVRALGRLLWTVLTGDVPDADGAVPQLRGASPRQAAVNRILRATLGDAPGYSSAARLRADLAHAAALPHDRRARVRRRPAPTTVAALVAGVAATLVGVASPDLTPDSSHRPPAPAGHAQPRHLLAVDSVARALVDSGSLPRSLARCTARRWVDDAGIQRLVAEGFLDDRMRYVERPAAAMSAPLRSSAVAAALHCRPPARS